MGGDVAGRYVCKFIFCETDANRKMSKILVKTKKSNGAEIRMGECQYEEV